MGEGTWEFPVLLYFLEDIPDASLGDRLLLAFRMEIKKQNSNISNNKEARCVGQEGRKENTA